MQLTYAAPQARLRPPVLAMALAVIGLLAMPVPSHAARKPDAMTSAGWQGRAIQNPQPRPRLVRASWPKGWSAGPVGLGTGYHRPGGSKRVREVQRRLRQLGYRPGPVDGLFGPRTRAATRWFQFKHGLATTGRVNRWTLTVLKARSDHKPLRTKVAAPGTEPVAPLPSPTPVPASSPDDGSPILMALLLLALALGVGVIAGLLAPELRRRKEPAEQPPAAPALNPPPAAPLPAAPRRPRPATREAPAVLGYAVVESDGDEADTATAALAVRCAHRGWRLIEVIHDGNEPGRRLGERPGLTYALKQIRSGTASGLVVARLRDFTTRIADLATLLRWLAEANAFLGAADHELDTSTRSGKATARAIIDLGGWERRLISKRTREDLVSGHFTPRSGHRPGELTQQIAAMHARGISLRAITDALNLAGIETPEGRRRWHTTDVKAATEVRHRM
jgi:peptidoglycan hydrolase-like protein with peptidoglycan-binding domain/DNA invertase Pin-like site-specific DNA recombinase